MMLALSRTPIDPHGLEAEVISDACGAVVAFVGIVRAISEDGRRVNALCYEAYEPLALAEFEAIANEARERFGNVRLAMIHRVGELGIGEVAVAVTVAAAHRSAAFRACEYAIDQLKARAAIWKKERYVDGAGAWIANACMSADAARDR